MAADGLSLQDLHARAELAAFADMDVARDVRAWIDCHKVFQDNIMADGAVEIDDDMATDVDVDGQDRLRADDAPFADLVVV